MTEGKALILEVKGNSLDDGPGIRTVIFFKGCPLSCDWCHNPESKSARTELSFDAKTCIGCCTCMEICPAGALSNDNACFVDRARCDLCLECVEACPSGALERVGVEMTVESLISEIAKDEPFFRVSGGGVTLSGGEPLLNIEFAGTLAAALKARGVHVLVETCGLFDFGRFAELVLPHVDTVYLDIKLMDFDEHRRHCGVSNTAILENISRLSRLGESTDVDLLIRMPLVPGITATRENLTAVAGFLSELGLDRVALLPYNPLWHEKCEKIGGRSPYEGVPGMTSWMTSEEVASCVKIFEDRGVHVI